jgi:hypothetical protein
VQSTAIFVEKATMYSHTKGAEHRNIGKKCIGTSNITVLRTFGIAKQTQIPTNIAVLCTFMMKK